MHIRHKRNYDKQKASVVVEVSILGLPITWEIQGYAQGRSQDFSKGGAEVMEAKALKRKNCL